MAWELMNEPKCTSDSSCQTIQVSFGLHLSEFFISLLVFIYSVFQQVFGANLVAFRGMILSSSVVFLMHKNFPEHKINSKIISTNKTRTVLSTDATTVRSLVGDALALVVQNMATVVAGVVIEFTANWILALVMYEQASQVANDAVGSIRTVASFCAEEKVMDMYQKKCDGPMKSGIRLEIVSSASLGVGSSVLFLVNSFIFYIGSVLEKHGKATFAEIFRVFFALTMTAIGVSMTIGMAPDIDKVKNSAASIFQILDSKPKIDPAMKKAQL